MSQPAGGHGNHGNGVRPHASFPNSPSSPSFPSFERVVIFGAGAVGSYLGARLSRVVPTVLVGRRAHVEAIGASGLRLSGTLSQTVRVEATDAVPRAGGRDLVVVAVKCRSLAAAAAALASRVERAEAGTTALCVQNGVDPDERLRSELARRGRSDLRVLRALVSAGVNLVRPGEVEYWGGPQGDGSELTFPDTSEARPVAALFERAGVAVSLETDFAAEVWKKLAVNCVANPLGAVLGVRNREVVSPALRDLRRAVVDEVRLCARDRNVELAAGLAERIDRALSASGNRSSMLQDIARGRATEIDELSGRVVAMAREGGREAPANATLARLVRFLERSGHGRD